jgi:glyoxylase-like metal-dependent hydrolase (beta-lactamase superfamily II)
MNTITIGEIAITRVEEMHGPIMPPDVFFPSVPAEEWKNHAELVPDHIDAEASLVEVAMQTWVLKSNGKTILIDTGVGNDKARPAVDVWDHNSIDFLGALSKAGVEAADVDLVVNTHLHVDHVGWNTFLRDGEWHPTFPKATYLVNRLDFEFWNPATNDTVIGSVNENVYEDSVAPVHLAGQIQLWEGTHAIDDSITLQAAPGHTPGHSVVLLESGGQSALFAADLIHSPIQIPLHEHNSCFCLDAAGAVASRRNSFDWAIEHDALVLPAHISGHGAFRVARASGGYAIQAWADFDRL